MSTTRERLAALRDELATELAAGRPPRALLQRLASEDGVALAELVVGPRAPASPALVEAALEVLPALEAAVAPKGLYQRLVGLTPATRGLVLAHAASRHPLAAWLVPLSEKVEGEEAGLVHLVAAAEHPAFAWACQAHATAGHRRGLIQATARLRRPEPAAALAAEGHLDAAAEAAVRLLELDPASPVVAWVGAAWGPDLDRLLVAAVRYLRDARTAAALAPWVDALPRARALLAAVGRALPPAPPAG